ncbi:unnamed protein product, partial [Polarella glacialis]
VQAFGGGCASELCSRAVAKLDDEGAAVLLLLGLGALCNTSTGDVEAIQDVLDVLKIPTSECRQQGPVHPGLRAFGVLALLASVLDLRKVVDNSADNRSANSEAPSIQEVFLPQALPPQVLQALSASCAMDWPASDTGGVSFSSVVTGHAGAVGPSVWGTLQRPPHSAGYSLFSPLGIDGC